MGKISYRKRNIFIAVVMILMMIAAAVFFFSSKSDLLDQEQYDAFRISVEQANDEGRFTDQEALRQFITSWADEAGIEYKVDKAGNIIFRREAIKRKKSVSPTVICVSYNYETAGSDARLLASAAMIAASDIDSSQRTVIFFNDVRNEGKGYTSVSSKYLGSKSKIIYLDYGSSSYLSCSSFARAKSTIKVPAVREPVKYDTAVKIHISGITSAEIGTGGSERPNPVSALSSMLSRLKSKSTVCQLASLSIESNGNMYPVGADTVILLNSYSVDSFTKYIDKMIKTWEKNYRDDYPDMEFTYEIIDDPEELPEEAYSQETTYTLSNVLYTTRTGAYKYEEGDNIPEGRDQGSTCGSNTVTGITAVDDSISISLLSQGYDQTIIDRISGDNTAAAELFDCKFKQKKLIPEFRNDKDSLSRVIITTYSKTNDSSGSGSVLETDADNYFTPCSYLAEASPKSDIIHIRLNKNKAEKITNTILQYISTKGNFFSK